jgi:dihydrolipoamide dehydrogenase
MKFELGHVTTGVDVSGKTVKATIAPFKDGKADESKARTIEGDRILLAIGVTGRFDGLFDDSLGLEIVKGHIKTDYVPGELTPVKKIDYKTNLPGIYAVGDVIGPPWLAHVSSEEAILCVERIAWREKKLDHEPHPMDYSVIPGCTYCRPQIASVGLSEARAKAAGYEVRVGRFPFVGNGKAIALGEPEGMVKTVFDKKTGELLGAHMIGAEVTELIQGYGVAMTLETTEAELMHTVFPHPTLSEMMHESVLDAYGRAIHF